ncbi:MAG TPA: hypothetical protein VD741_05845 [Solirubrobacterales bacterium]|nr:hypothetical protein [Solirubrobacterales bacterium]
MARAYLWFDARYLHCVDGLPRPLTAEESELIRVLLEHEDFPGRDGLLTQVPAARVIGRCGCGCATVELAVERGPAPDALQEPIPTEAMVLGEDGSEIGGVRLFAKGGCLNQLEIYSVDEDPIRSVPSPDRLSIR